MIQLYTWKTPNGRKPAIMLEETGLAYRVHGVDIGADEQFRPGFLAIAPNNKIPAIVDEETGVTLFESGAILGYLADKSGMLRPSSGPGRWTVEAWVHWSIGGLGPMVGQLNFFANRAPEKAPLATDRFRTECERLLGVLERRLSDSSYIGGAGYSIADIVSYPWLMAAKTVLAEPLGPAFGASPALTDWLVRVGERPAVKAGMRVLEPAQSEG